MSRKLSLIVFCLFYFFICVPGPLCGYKFVVTGGAGFIGSHLVDALIEEGHEVIILDNLSTGHRAYLNPKATFIQGDICDREALKHVFSQGIDGCFHLAAVSSVQKSNEEWFATHTVNASGTVVLFEEAIAHKFPIIYASSAAVYGNYTHRLVENDTPKPLTAYAVDKYGCELQAGVAYRVHGIPSTGLRFFNVYGPRQDPLSSYSGVIAIFAKQILKGEPIKINGDGTQARDFIYVTDVVRALIAAMHKKLNHPQGADIYNVCTGQPTTLLTLISTLEEIVGRKVKRLSNPMRKGDIYFLVGRPDKLEKDLGISSHVRLSEGLKKTIESLAAPTEHG